MELLDEQRLREMVYGGAVLGAGGGGSIAAGLKAGHEALTHGQPRLVHIDELSPETLIATLSIVGSVGGMSGDQPLAQHGLALRRLAEEGRSVGAVISSEVGPQAVTYGWRESAISGIPIVDAPCNGRAHPLGLMGSLGLHRHATYVTTTIGIGGSNSSHNRVELSLHTSAFKASKIIRSSSASAGIPLAVARNPLPASYVRKHAAVGGLKYANQVGNIMLSEMDRGLPHLLQSLSGRMGGRILSRGRVISAVLTESKGFTVGRIIIEDQHRDRYSIAVCNEYLSLQKKTELVAAFPDLITLFDFDTSLPLDSSQVKPGMSVAALAVPRARLRLGSTMKDGSLLRPIERFLKVKLRGSGMQIDRTGSLAGSV